MRQERSKKGTTHQFSRWRKKVTRPLHLQGFDGSLGALMVARQQATPDKKGEEDRGGTPRWLTWR